MTDVTTITRRELVLWAICAAAVTALHVGGGVGLGRYHDAFKGDVSEVPVIVDLEPITLPGVETQQDLAPGPEQPIMEQPPEPRREQKPQDEEEKPKVEPPPPQPEAEVTLPREEAKPQPEPLPQPEQPRPTAPPRKRVASRAEVGAWHDAITKQIELNKGYPPGAMRRRASGVTHVGFALDREGHVLDSRIVRSSGDAALDEEAIATLHRARFPPPPEDEAGDKFEFTTSVKFTVKSR